MRRVILSGVGAAVLFVVAAVAVKWYVWDIVIGQAGDSDRSMLFWGLPILFAGVFAAMGAGVLVFVTIRAIRA